MVPLCFGLSTYLAHWLSRYGITRIGGDTSLMSALVGALCGEAKGHHELRRGSWMEVEEVNDLDLTSLAEHLVACRPRPRMRLLAKMALPMRVLHQPGSHPTRLPRSKIPTPP